MEGLHWAPAVLNSFPCYSAPHPKLSKLETGGPAVFHPVHIPARGSPYHHCVQGSARPVSGLGRCCAIIRRPRIAEKRVEGLHWAPAVLNSFPCYSAPHPKLSKLETGGPAVFHPVHIPARGSPYHHCVQGSARPVSGLGRCCAIIRRPRIAEKRVEGLHWAPAVLNSFPCHSAPHPKLSKLETGGPAVSQDSDLLFKHKLHTPQCLKRMQQTEPSAIVTPIQCCLHNAPG